MFCDAVFYIGLFFLNDFCGINFEKKPMILDLKSQSETMESISYLQEKNMICEEKEKRQGKKWTAIDYKCKSKDFEFIVAFYNDRLYSIGVYSVNNDIEKIYDDPCCSLLHKMRLNRFESKLTSSYIEVIHGVERGKDFISITDYWFGQAISKEMEVDPEIEE